MPDYNPIKYAGPHAVEITSAIVHSNDTVEKGQITFITDVKGEMNFTEASTGVKYGAYKENRSESELNADTTKLKDKTLRPRKMEAIEEFGMAKLNTSRFNSTIQAGAINVLSTEFEQLVVGQLWVPELGTQYEDKIWNAFSDDAKTAIAALATAPATAKTIASNATADDSDVDGLLSRLIQANDYIHVQAVAGGILPSNIVEEYGKVYEKIPTALMGKPTLRLYVPRSHKSKIMRANLDQQFRDVFTVNGDKVYFLDVEIEFTKIEGVMIAATKEQLVGGTDLTSDANLITVKEKNSWNDMYVMRNVITLDTLVLNSKQIVLYI